MYDKTNLISTFSPIDQELGDEGKKKKCKTKFFFILLMLNSKKFLTEFYATMPGLDSFVLLEKSQRIRNFLEVLHR